MRGGLLVMVLVLLVPTLAHGQEGAEAEAEAEAETETETEAEAEAETETETESESGTETETEDGDGDGDGDEDEGDAVDEPLELLTARRAQPSYDGRAEAGPTFGQQLLWIPRALFFPIYVVWEYLIRVPIGAAVPELEKADAVALLFDFFTWGERNAGIVPTFFFDFGFLPSVGLYFFWNDVFADGNDVRIWGGFWGTQYIHGTILDRYEISDRTELEFKVDFLRRPDQIYSGEGYDIRVGDDRARYNVNLFEAYARFRQDYWRESLFLLQIGAEHWEFDDTDWGDEPSVPEAIEQGIFSQPANFDVGYTKIYQAMYLSLDTRRPRPYHGSGIRIQTYGELGWNAQNLVNQRWFRWGATGGAWLDAGHQRRIGVGFGALFSDPVGSEPVPFEELIRIGDFPNLITGFLPGDLRGRSAAGMSLVYRYPIWVWLEGVLNVSVANVFGEHLEDFELDRLRLTWGLGISTIGERDTPFTFEVAWGTETFEQGTRITSFRLAFGATQL